jgi:hypothetical protein
LESKSFKFLDTKGHQITMISFLKTAICLVIVLTSNNVFANFLHGELFSFPNGKDNHPLRLNQRMPESYHFFKIADSKANGYTYGYAPSILKLDLTYHAFYCSNSEPGGGLDSIRYTFSLDSIKWSKPQIILRARPNIDPTTRKMTNRAACDPSVVLYKGYYYLYYSNNHQTALVLGNEATTAQTTISVARAHQIDGKYLTYTKRGTWEDNPLDVKNIVLPQIERHGSPGSYGAGQQTVLVKDGKIYMWFTDDSVRAGQNIEVHTYFLQSSNPLIWGAKPIRTNISNMNSFDVKYDPKSRYFVAIGILKQHTSLTSLAVSKSVDGIIWSKPKTIIPEGNFPRFTHNSGTSSDNQGFLIDDEDPMLGFGAPYDLSPMDEWGKWNLFGMRIKIPKN